MEIICHNLTRVTKTIREYGQEQPVTYLPIELDIKGLPVMVVGGGPVGERKVRRLLACGARVWLAATEVSPGLAEMIGQGLIERQTSWDEDSLLQAFLVVAATSDRELNARLAQKVRQAGGLVVEASDPGLGNAILPAVMERGRFRLTVSTGGASPALAAKVKEELAEKYGPEYELMTALLARLRPLILASGGAQSENALLFRRIVGSAQLWESLKQKHYQDALNLLGTLIHPLELGPDFRFW